MQRRLFFILFFFCIAFCTHPAQAATLALSPSDTDIDSINSLTLTDAFATQPVSVGVQKVVVFGVTFSLHAFEHPIQLTLGSGYARASALSAHRASLSVPFHFDSRFGARGDSAERSGIVVWTLMPRTHAGVASSTLMIPRGNTGETTLLVAYASTPSGDREDRLVIDGMALTFGSSTAPIHLNPSEVAQLKTPFMALSDTP